MKNLNMLATLSLFAALEAEQAATREGMPTPREPDREPDPPKPKKVTKPIPKGLTRFDYGENHLYALNQRTADKKAKKKGWI